MEDFSGIELDRNQATQGSEVHLTITDGQLNIDPTAEDVVTFLVTAGSEGVSFSNGTGYGSTGSYKAFDIATHFDDNGKLLINYDTNGVADVFVDDVTLDDLIADKYLVFWEGPPRTVVSFTILTMMMIQT